MLRDITIGQHFPGNSILHTMDPRVKLLLTIAYIVMLFVGSNPAGLVISIVFLTVLYLVAKIPLKIVGKSIKPILPIILFTAVLNLFFMTGTSEPLVSWWILKIYKEGIYYAVIMAVRIICLIAGTSLLTYTTSPIVLTDAIEQLLHPLAKLHLPVHELAMMMTIALRFIPTLIEETDKIMNAQKARGAQLDSGNLRQRVKALIPVLIPLFISAFRRADELAMAMECRCYHGGEGRTRLKQLHMHRSDILIAVVAVLVFVAIGMSNLFFARLHYAALCRHALPRVPGAEKCAFGVRGAAERAGKPVRRAAAGERVFAHGFRCARAWVLCQLHAAQADSAAQASACRQPLFAGRCTSDGGAPGAGGFPRPLQCEKQRIYLPHS